jgi:hypothetical protein
MKLTSEQSAACDALLQVLSVPKGSVPLEPGSGEDWRGEDFDDDHFGHDDAEDNLEDPDDDVHEDASSFFEDKLPFVRDPQAIGEITHTAEQAHLLDLLLTLYTHLPTGRDAKFWSPITRFIVLYSIRSGGRWLNSRQITHTIAALLFCGRLLMMVLMYREVLKKPDIRYAGYVVSVFIYVVLILPILSAYKVIAPYLDDDREAPIPTMYILMRPLNKFVSAEDGAFEFTALNFNGDNIIIDGRVLYLHDIRRFVECLLRDVQDHINLELFFGMDVASRDWFPDSIHEEPRNMKVSYSSFDDPRNPFHRHKDTLLQLILTHPQLRNVFHFVDYNGKIVWKPGPCFAYMEAAHKVEMKMFSVTQVTAGEPPRAVESAAHLFRNVAGGTLRNVFIMFQHLVLMGTYNKTTHLTERDETMIRVPLPEVGRLWILYLTYVRPLIVVWQKYFNGPKAAHRVKHCLFAGPHRPVSASELSRNLSFHTEEILGVKISVSRWRHIVTWFMNHNSNHFQAYLTNAAQSTLARQMGHTSRTHSLYSSDSRLPSSIDFHNFFQTMLCSAIWHELLGFTPTLLNAMTHFQPGLSELRRGGSLGFLEASGNMPAPPSAQEIAIEIVRLITPEIARIYTHSRANDLASFLHLMGIDVQTPLSRPLPPPPLYTVHPSRAGALRRFLKDEKATFKHPQQALAVEFMAQGNSSLILISPTGMYLIGH